MKLSEYQDKFKTAAVSRDEAGVLTIRLHSRGESMWWGYLPHRELPELFNAVASDRDNRVVVITGTGEVFLEIPEVVRAAGNISGKDLARGKLSVAGWDQAIWEGNRLVRNLLEIEVPVIAAVNGPVTIHSEIAVLSDIVLCTPDTFFSDQAHFATGLVPGDGMQIVWPMLLGPNRGRYFLLANQQLAAEEARSLGVVAEIIERDQLLERAYEHAHRLAERNPVLLRNTRHVLVRSLRRAMNEDLHFGLAVEAVASIYARDWYAERDHDAADDGSKTLSE